MQAFSTLTEGDQIYVVSPGSTPDYGVFLRIENDFLIWVKNNDSRAVYAITSLEGISVYKI